MFAICGACMEFVLPNGDGINFGSPRFTFDGVLLNENARPTLNKNNKTTNYAIVKNLSKKKLREKKYLHSCSCRKLKCFREGTQIYLTDVDINIIRLNHGQEIILKQ